MQHLGDRLVFGGLRDSLGWSRSFLRRGALVPFTANGAHRLLRGYLLAIGDAGMGGGVFIGRLSRLSTTTGRMWFMGCYRQAEHHYRQSVVHGVL